jgi:hypothetical protein
LGTLRIKAFNRLHHNKLASPDTRLSFAPRGALFRFRLGSTLETRFRPAPLSFREPPACSAFDPQQDRPDSASVARWRRLSATRRVNATNASSTDFSIPPEPETRNGLSLARNDACATITGSKLPACSFASARTSFAGSFDLGLSARLGFEAATGRIHRL